MGEDFYSSYNQNPNTDFLRYFDPLGWINCGHLPRLKEGPRLGDRGKLGNRRFRWAYRVPQRVQVPNSLLPGFSAIITVV